MEIQPCAGLANRLRALVSAMCAAGELGIPLTVYWLYEPGICPVALEQLFEPNALEPRFILVTGPPSKPLEFQSCLSPDDYNTLLKSAPPYRIKSHGHFYQKSMPRWLTVFRSIPFRRDIVDYVNGVFGPNRPVGVHIRRTDNMKSRTESPLGAFWSLLDSYRQDTRFFVCSDDPAEIDEVRKKYGSTRVISLTTQYNRITPAAGLDTCVDFVGLTRCREIIGSAGSSFSEMAAAYGAIPLRIARKPTQYM